MVALRLHSYTSSKVDGLPWHLAGANVRRKQGSSLPPPHLSIPIPKGAGQPHHRCTVVACPLAEEDLDHDILELKPPIPYHGHAHAHAQPTAAAEATAAAPAFCYEE